MTIKSDIKLSLVISEHMRKLITIDRHERACHGISLTQHFVIDTLKRKKSLSMNELSLELGLAISTLTRIVDVLVRDDILIRKSNEQDRRKVCVELTSKGIDLAKTLKKCTERFWSFILQSIPDSKKEEMIDNIKLLNEALDKSDSSCCPYKNQKE